MKELSVRARKANGGIKAAEPCATTGCSDSAKTAGYCSACYQGTHRLGKQTLAYLNFYLYRVSRLGSRGKAVLAARRTTKSKVA